jgi:hypothetical protein
MTTRKFDGAAAVLLLALWLLFFWRLLTPIPGDQASVTKGDFSGQFFAFAAYQYDRLTQGQIPLWNPYNNGGLPFVADTQTATFYPPRLLTIALSHFSGGWRYHALELEMAFHILLYSLFMYLLVRQMLGAGREGAIGALIAALIASYGGFMSGYPVQQLAILEAGIWLPLVILGLLENARRADDRWLLLAALGLGLSWLAGHPQTSWFLTYLAAGYLVYQAYTRRLSWRSAIRRLLIFGMVTFGLAAVQLLPGIEYLARTARVDLTYEAKGNGFPFRDILQVLFPGQFSLFSPLYVGITGLGLALVALWTGEKARWFWAGTALLALGLSFGANSALFPALYNLLPGLRFFRGQERAAYLAANSVAILAGYGISSLLQRPAQLTHNLAVRRALIAVVAACALGIVLALSGWAGENPAETLNTAVFSTMIAGATAFVILRLLRQPASLTLPWVLVGLLTFDLFTHHMSAAYNYEASAPDQQPMSNPALLAPVIADPETIFRVDGFRGLHDNFGSLYGIKDMRGISPLFLDGPFQLIEPEKINPLAWELFAVKYVYSDWQALPVPSEIVTAGEDRYGPVSLHRLTDPRPFAHLLYRAETVDSDAFARALLRDPQFDPRHTVILHEPLTLQLPEDAPSSAHAAVTYFAPEQIIIEVSTPQPAVLSLAHPDYPGWQATINGAESRLMRAYGGLTALAVPAGQHTVELLYIPRAFQAGAILSLFTWGGLGILIVWWFVRHRGHRAADR